MIYSLKVVYSLELSTNGTRHRLFAICAWCLFNLWKCW